MQLRDYVKRGTSKNLAAVSLPDGQRQAGEVFVMSYL